MSILVTGGAGFIGSNFLGLLSETYPNDGLVCVDKLTYAGNIDNIRYLINGGMHFYQADIATPDMDRILMWHNPEIVINFAAETHVDRSIREPEAFIKADILGVFNLVYFCMKYKVKKFIHISTDEVYGPMPAYSNCYAEADESSILNPTSPYSASKAAADLLLLSYYKTYNFPLVIVRPCNNYGPRQYPEKLIPMVITRLLQDKKILMHGEGREVREWIYVEDCCKAIKGVMDKGKIGEIYNIGSGDRKSNLNVVREILDGMHIESPYNDNIEFVKNRPGNDARYAINSRKIMGLFGKEGSHFSITNFAKGLFDTISWYMMMPDFWSNVDLEANIYDEKEGKYLR